MKKFLLIGITFMVIFSFSSIMPLASAQNADQGYQSSSIEEHLKIEREKMLLSRNQPFCDQCWGWYQDLLNKFYLTIIIIGIVSGTGISVLLIKSRRSHNKTREKLDSI